MKKILLIGAAFALAISAFATGNEGVNPQQNGILNYNSSTTLIQTNTFAFPYQSVPVVTVQGLSTNGAPFTVSGITTTNFVLTTTANSTTNASVAWQSFVGGTRLQYGSNTVSTTSTNVSFPYVYAVAPAVTISGISTNLLITAITLTNFTIGDATAAATGYSWISVGTVANPQSEYQGPFPVNNKVLY